MTGAHGKIRSRRGAQGPYMGLPSDSAIQPLMARYRNHIAATPRTKMPTKASSSTRPATLQASVIQNVRICQRKCDSSQVPATASRFA